ncbi:MAG: 2-hydroxyacid dehydrogenase [Actinomycetes bacterium]
MPTPEGPTIAITRTGLPGFDPAALGPGGSIRQWPGTTPPDPVALAELCAPAEGLLCQSSDRIDRAFLERCPQLRVVSTVSAGTDHLDLRALAERHIAAGHTPDVPTEATADLTFALILAARRRLVEANRWVSEGRWVDTELNAFLGHDVHGATLGIIGYGSIGRAVAKRASGFGMTILYHSRHKTAGAAAQWVELDELLRTADIVSVHTPLTTSTQHLIGRRELALMKPTSVLINTSRGAVVDGGALAQALAAGHIAAAALDVLEVEPPEHAEPLIHAENVIIVPHIGSATWSTRQRMVQIAVDNLVHGMRGEALPYPVIDRDRLS